MIPDDLDAESYAEAVSDLNRSLVRLIDWLDTLPVFPVTDEGIRAWALGLMETAGRESREAYEKGDELRSAVGFLTWQACRDYLSGNLTNGHITGLARFAEIDRSLKPLVHAFRGLLTRRPR